MSRRTCAVLLLLLVPGFFGCVSEAPGQERPVALVGTVLMPGGAVPGGTVLVEHGVIVDAGARVAIPKGALVVKVDGVIAPGLIDLHNHLTWNVFPRWTPSEEFGSRYDWQQKPVYKVLMEAPHKALVDEGLECDAERYAEVKAITQGETSAVGSMHAACTHGLVRNLDGDAELGAASAQGTILYNVFPLQATEAEVAEEKQALAHGGALLIHLAEGAPGDASAAREFAMLRGRGLLVPGVSLIHGGGFHAEDFQAMHGAGVGFIWSPRSNIELYGATADVGAAKTYGVVTALAPDWSPTGSDGLLSELKYAATWNASQTAPLFEDRELAAMATTAPASLVHLDKVLGQITKGYAADILVLREHAQAKGMSPWWTLLHASPEDVRLVMIGGVAVYGDADLMGQALGGGATEALTVCGAPKRISFASEPGKQPEFRETETRLRAGLGEWGRRLAPLAECGH